MRVLTAVALSALVLAHHPQSGIVDLAAASEDGGRSKPEEGQLEDVQATSIRSFLDTAGQTRWVKATEHFFLAGETIVKDTFVQVKEEVAKELFRMNRAEPATDADVAAAKAEDAAAATAPAEDAAADTVKKGK